MKYSLTRALIIYIVAEHRFGGSRMNDRRREIISLIVSEAIDASLIGLIIISQPVVKGNALRL